MLVRTLLAISLLTVSAHASGFERTLQVSNAPDLSVATGAGHIHIFPGSDSQVHIRAHVYSGWGVFGNSEVRIRRIEDHPPIEQNGNQIRIGQSSDHDLFNNITIDYEIAAPRGSALDLTSGSGEIRVDNVGRSLKAQAGSGTLRALGIHGPADLRTGSGDIELDEHGQGEVRATAGSGSIRIRGLDGQLTARTGSGDIDASGEVTGASRLQSGSGSIHVQPGADAHYTVEADTGSGSIRIAGEGDADHHHVSREVNGGGPTIEAHTGSGSIEIGGSRSAQ